MPSTSADAPLGVTVTIGFGNCMNSLADWLFSGKLAQFPGLRLSYAESQIGWIPYLLERADDVWKQHHAWVSTGVEIAEPPSTYYYRQVYGCFFRDHHGMESLDEVRRRQRDVRGRLPALRLDVARQQERSRPRSWPASTPDVVHKLVRGNAIKLFGLDLPDTPTPTAQLASSWLARRVRRTRRGSTRHLRRSSRRNGCAAFRTPPDRVGALPPLGAQLALQDLRRRGDGQLGRRRARTAGST